MCVLSVAAALFTGCSKSGSAKGPVTVNLWSFSFQGNVEKWCVLEGMLSAHTTEDKKYYVGK